MSIQFKRQLVQVVFLILTIVGVFSALSGLLIIAFGLLAGPIFCGWICPFGFIQDLLIKIRCRLGIKQIRFKGHSTLTFSRYLLLVLSLVNVGAFLNLLFINDPRNIFHQLLNSGTLSLVNISVLLSFLIIGLFSDRFFCRYLCPEGAKHALIGFGRAFKVSRSDKCINCGKCNRTCPMGVTVTKETTVNDLNCISCMECMNSCPVNGAIEMKAQLSKRKVLIALVLSAVLVLVPMVQQYTSVALSQPVDESSLNEGQSVLEGQAQGFKSLIQVQVIKSQDGIDDILIIAQNDDARWFNDAKQVIDKMLQAQSTDVDTVSGATYSSQGIINATKNALGEEFQEQTVYSGHRRH